MSDRKSRKRSSKVQDLNLTSMMDVCFLLLTFFLLTLTFTPFEGALGLPLLGAGPPHEHEIPPPVGPHLIMETDGVHGVKMHFIGDEAPFTGFAELYDRLVRLNESVYGPGSPLLIRPHAQVSWKHVVDALNQAKRADFNAQLVQPL